MTLSHISYSSRLRGSLHCWEWAQRSKGALLCPVTSSVHLVLALQIKAQGSLAVREERAGSSHKNKTKKTHTPKPLGVSGEASWEGDESPLTATCPSDSRHSSGGPSLQPLQAPEEALAGRSRLAGLCGVGELHAPGPGSRGGAPHFAPKFLGQ